LWNNRRVTHLILAVVLSSPAAALPQAPVSQRPAVQTGRPAGSPAAQDARDEAYYQFMLGRRLEDTGDVDGALKAFRRALELDPGSAEIQVELATLFARQGRVAEARAAAEAGAKADPDNSEVNRLLGMITAEDAHSDDDAAASTPESQQAARSAIGYLERALKTANIDTASSVRLSLGRLYAQVREFDKAIPLLRQVTLDEPGFAQGIAMLAEAYTASGKNAAAIQVLADAAERDPNFYGALGEAYEKSEQWGDAAPAYAKASAARPRDVELKTHWALALLNLGEPAQVKHARELLLDVTKVTPGAPWPLYLLCRAQRESGDLDGAEATARRLVALAPAGVSGPHLLAQVLGDRHDFEGVIAAVAPAIEKIPESRTVDRALLLTHLGFAYMQTNRLAESAATFERALALTPDDAGLASYLGQALNLMKQYDKALAVVGPRRAKAPADVRLVRVEADALRGQGRVDEGAALLRALVDGPRRSPEAFLTLGEYYAAAHRYADGAAVLKQALATYLDDLDVQFQYGAMLDRQKQTAEAEKVFRTVIAKDPEHAPALNYLGYALIERGDRLQEAFALISKAVELDPHNGAYLDSLGWVCFKLGKLDDAEKHLQVAAAQLPADSVVQDHWGDLLARRGRTSDAVGAWKQSLAGDGEGIDRPSIERKIRKASARVPQP
jgi:tetratricopeptide (TPR) repeat protein